MEKTNVSQKNTPTKAVGSSPYTEADLNSLRAEVVNTSPETAKLLRATCHFDRQRPIALRNVERLSLEMRRGWFIKGTPIFIAVLPDNSMVIVNGNHTLEAVHASGVTVPLTFIYAKVPDADAAARIYANMDMQKTRTWANALQAVGTDIPLANQVVPAVGIIMAGFKTDPDNAEAGLSRTARFAKLEEYRDAAMVIAVSWLHTPRTNQRLLRRSSFMAVALETARYQPSAAEEFWGGAARDDGLQADDPRKALLRYAMGNKSSSGSGSQRAIGCKAAALAWNAWFQDKPLTLVKPGSVVDFRLAGTPWHKGAPEKAPPAKPLFETGIAVNGSGSQPVARFAG